MTKRKVSDSRGYGLTNPLQALSPIPIKANRDPATADIGPEVGTVWINVLTNDCWLLTSVAANAANWEPIGQDTGGAAPITKYVVDADGSGDYTTIQAALDAANALAPDATVIVRPGAYVEDLTLYDGINIFGTSVLDTTITGVHTPPAAGTFSVWNVTLASATDIFTSAAAGTTAMFVNACLINVTNGYVFDLVNWTGDLSIDNCGSAGTNDGVVNNTGGSTVRILGATVGAGVGNSLTLDDGALEIFGSVVQCPSALGAATTIEIEGGSVIEGTLTTAGTANGTIQNTSIVTGATAAIAHGSAGVLVLAQVTINSANATPIGGAGAGALDLGNVSFVQNSAIAGTVTQTYMRATDRVSPYVVGATGNFATIQEALDAADDSGVDQLVYVQPGTYTEDLTLYDGIDIRGASISTTTITGLHTPPAAGTFQIHDCTLTSATDVFNSAVAGTTDITIEGCVINATNGFLLNLLNWTGTLLVDDCDAIGTNDGFVSNTGGATIVLADCIVGAGVGNPFVASGGTVEMVNAQVMCPGTFGGASTVTTLGNCYFGGTITTADTATVTISQSEFSTGATAAIAHGSANVLTLAQVTINSSNATPIGGAGAGALDMGNIDFVQNSGIAGTITQTYMRATDRVTPYVVGATGNFATIQEALDAADDSGVDQLVYVQPGTYTEDLTLYDGIDIRGASISTTTITGLHTPPAAGTFQIHDCTLTSATDVFNSAVAGTTDITIEGCVINATNGFLLNLLNWTGTLLVDDCDAIGTNDGFVSNTGGATIVLADCIVGAGVGNPFVASGGTVEMVNAQVMCPGTFGGASTVTTLGNCYFGGTITTADTATVTISQSEFSTGATAAISQGSAGTLGLSNCSISSSNNPAIDGAGAGVVNISGCEFADGSNLAATLTLSSASETRSTKLLCGDSTYRVALFNVDDNIIQAYSDDATASGASELSAIQGNQTVSSGDGNHTPNGVFGSITASSGSNALQCLGVYGYANQADGSVIASTFVGVEGHCDIDETDAADLPQIYAFGAKGWLQGEDAGGVPATGEFAGVGAVVQYNTPFNAYAYGVCATRLGGGAGTAGRAALGVAQGTQAIPDWLYGLDLFNTTPGNAGQAYTTADIRMQNESTIAVQAEGVTFSGDVNVRAFAHTNTDITFNANPVLQSILDTGAAPSGATGATNILTCQEGYVMEEFIIGAGQTIIAPRMENSGLLISLDLTATEGVEYNFGVFTSAKHQFVAGTSPAFYFEAEFTVADSTGCEPLFMGFRTVGANNANFVAYNDIAGMGIITTQNSELVTLATRAGAGVTYTNTTDAFTDGQTHTFRVNVDAAGAVTYLLDGVAPTAVAAYSFGAVSVMPYISLLHAAVAPGAIHLVSLECGFQAWN